MSLRDFIGQMEEKNEVLHIKEPLSTRFEMSYFMKSFDNNGPILSFDKVKNHGGRVVANVCGTRKRLCSGLNVDENGLCGKLMGAWRSPRKSKVVADGPVMERKMKSVDLSSLPILTHFERDAGPYVTS